MDEYISASKYYKQDTRVQNGTRPQYQTYYKEYICVVLYQPYFENIFPFTGNFNLATTDDRPYGCHRWQDLFSASVQVKIRNTVTYMSQKNDLSPTTS